MQRYCMSAQDALSAAMRPISRSGRPLTGFARPGTGGLRPGTDGGALTAVLRTARPATGTSAATARPLTSSGRAARLGTATLAAAGAGAAPFLDMTRLDMRKYAACPGLSRVLADYLLHVVRVVVGAECCRLPPCPGLKGGEQVAHARKEAPSTCISLPFVCM